MSVSVHALAINEDTFPAEYNGQQFDVTYRPQALTPGFYKELAEAIAKETHNGQAAAFWINRVVKAWDLVGDDGQPLPLDEKWLANQTVITTTFMWDLARQINEHRSPKGTSSTPNVEPLDVGSLAG